MDTRKQTKRTIFLVTALVSLVSAMVTFYLLVNEGKETVAMLAADDSKRVRSQLVEILDNTTKDVDDHYPLTVFNEMIGGTFDWVELYSATGEKIAEAYTDMGNQLESALPKHQYVLSVKEPTTLVTGFLSTPVARIILPIYKSEGQPDQQILGYLELGRKIPQWRLNQIIGLFSSIAVLAALSALTSGMVLYPRILSLLRRQKDGAQKILDSHIQVLESLGLAVSKRESGTGVHNYRVTWIAARLGKAMGLKTPDIKRLIAGSFLHDVGKIAIPDEILLKPGKLTPEEMEIMRSHVLHGEDIVRNLDWFADSNNIVSCHHERWDGTGYPRKLAGENIPIEARIFAVSDVFDALCSKRPYKEEFELTEVVNYIKEQSGKHFDPAVVSVFEKLADHLYEKTHGLNEDQAKALLNPLIKECFSVELEEGAWS